MRISPLVVPTLLGFAASAFAGVTVTTPSNNATVTSPTSFVATATTSTCRRGVASMGIYVDDQLVYVVNATSMNTTLRMSLGSHYVVVQEWDKCGGASKAPLNLNVIQPPTSSSSASLGTVSFGSVTVNAPAPGQTVSSPFLLSATNITCEGQPVSTMAYSMDSNSQLLGLVNGTSLATQVSASAGTHSLHVKSWGPNYAACDTDLSVNVVTSATSIIPSTASVTRNIQSFLNWQQWFDTGTITDGGTSASGSWTPVTSPSVSGAALRFVTNFTDNGGDLYYNNFASDQSSQNWFLDTYVYVAAPNNSLANVEMDLNQVLSNGDTVIYGFQCDGWNSVWDYTWTDTGTHWTQSQQPCNPRNWTTNTWHHVQIYFSRDNNENVTYHTVWFDNQEQDINATVHSGLALGWSNANILNFQIDGMGSSGSITTYLDSVNVYRW